MFQGLSVKMFIENTQIIYIIVQECALVNVPVCRPVPHQTCKNVSEQVSKLVPRSVTGNLERFVLMFLMRFQGNNILKFLFKLETSSKRGMYLRSSTEM